MKKARFGAKSRRGFTLIELIAVMAIMAIAAAMVMPNIKGMISKSEQSTYKNYCAEAATYVTNFTNSLTLGEEKFLYETDDGTVDTYNITTQAGLTSALNEYNSESEFQYYVLEFQEASATTDPTTSINSLFSSKMIQRMDTMVTVIVKEDSGGRVPKYELRGFWYMQYDKDSNKGSIVYTYYALNRVSVVGFKKLNKSSWK